MIQGIKAVYCQLKNNFKYISKSAFVWTSSLIAGFQIWGFMCGFDTVLPDDWKFINKFLVSAVFVGGIWILMFAIKSLCVLKNKSIRVIDAENGYHVYVEYGDLLEENAQERIIIITANRCFDTIVDNDLISSTSIHGMAITQS